MVREKLGKSQGISSLLMRGNPVLQYKICLYIVYLPPEKSPRSRDSNSFIEQLLNRIYMFSYHDMSLILGDLNARTGNLKGFINEVDEVPQRNCTIDDTTNRYEDALIDIC